MKKVLLTALLLVTATSVWADGFDLKAVMKQMRAEFKQVASAGSVDEMKAPLARLDSLVNQAKQGDYPADKQAVYLEGFNKLTVALDEVEQYVDAGEFDKAKQSLRRIDDLRKEYHDKRDSLFGKLFG